MNAKEWFEANNNSLCFSGCTQRSSWDDVWFLHDEITELFESAQPKWLPIESAPNDKDIQLAILHEKRYYTKVCWKSLNPEATLWQPLAERPKQCPH